MSKEEVLKWRCPIDDTPPENTEMLVKNPHNGSYNITNYIPAYGIFTCQSKSESMYGWKYFVIDDLNSKTKMSKEIIIEALIESSKWGSWAYESKWRERQGKTNLQDFKKWRRDVMEDIYNDYVNQNKDD